MDECIIRPFVASLDGLEVTKLLVDRIDYSIFRPEHEVRSTPIVCTFVCVTKGVIAGIIRVGMVKCKAPLADIKVPTIILLCLGVHKYRASFSQKLLDTAISSVKQPIYAYINPKYWWDYSMFVGRGFTLCRKLYIYPPNSSYYTSWHYMVCAGEYPLLVDSEFSNEWKVGRCIGVLSYLFGWPTCITNLISRAPSSILYRSVTLRDSVSDPATQTR